MTVVGLMVAGAAGAVLRYLVDRYVQGKVASGFPSGTLVINVTGSLVLGVLTGSALHHGLSATWVTVLGTGLIGAYTTFSTFTYDSFRLLGSDGMATALTNILVSVVAGLGAAVAGIALGTLI
ncbi:MAG TPA: fluoride efflux transporter CrcB [Acidimicrobiales bacterium]|nr:fluoride efflux transporter CrcB [Acidimicrobiales bacterium]